MGEIEEKRFGILQDLRTMIMISPGVLTWQYSSTGPSKKIHTLAAILWYALDANNARTRRTKLDSVDDLVELWHVAIVGLTIAHTKEEVEEHDYKMDDLLSPLLKAPVKQLREFYHKLVDALRDDPQVPYLIWSMFESWAEKVLDRAETADIIELKADMARDIAKAVEEDVTPMLPNAIMNALKWRSAEDLEKVMGALSRGKKPRLRGRQSCLYLVVGEDGDPEQAVVML